VCELDGKANQLDPSVRKDIAEIADHFPNGCGLQNMSKQKTGEAVVVWFVVFLCARNQLLSPLFENNPNL